MKVLVKPTFLKSSTMLRRSAGHPRGLLGAMRTPSPGGNTLAKTGSLVNPRTEVAFEGKIRHSRAGPASPNNSQGGNFESPRYNRGFAPNQMPPVPQPELSFYVPPISSPSRGFTSASPTRAGEKRHEPTGAQLARQPFTKLEKFDFNHYYKPMHPRLTDEHGMMFPQSSRNQWFWASFQLSIFELRYRVFHYPEPVLLPSFDHTRVTWTNVLPRPAESEPGFPPVTLASTGDRLFVLRRAGSLRERAVVEARCPDSGRLLCSAEVPHADAAFVRPAVLSPRGAPGEPRRTVLLVADGHNRTLCRLVHSCRPRSPGSSSESSTSSASPDSLSRGSGADGEAEPLEASSDSMELLREEGAEPRAALEECAGLSLDGLHGLRLEGNRFELFGLRGADGWDEPSVHPEYGHSVGGAAEQAKEPGPRLLQQQGDLAFLRSCALLFPRFGPSASSRPPLALLTARSSVHGVTSAFLHAYDATTKNRQTICWSPNEGVMTGVGYSLDGSHVFVAVTKDNHHLVFEFPVKLQREP